MKGSKEGDRTTASEQLKLHPVLGPVDYYNQMLHSE